MRAGIRFVFLILVPLLGSVASAQQLSSVETDKIRLLYFDPTETYLVPRVIQTFHNSADRQKSIFGYDPDGKVTVLLTDFSDYGNAGANSVPSNSLIVDIAPISTTFETAAPAERLYTIMNHELVHITNTDQTAPADERARRFFRGKVVATPEHPESILYQYLTAPRKTSPRWYLEGMAVFFETWMAGGLGRAQGYYDEMVFRAKVRDDAPFYDPLSLVSEGVRVDFQVGTNAYLYGTRFITYLAYAYSPEKVVEWARRDEGSRRSYEEEFDRVFGKRLNDAWQDWIVFEKEFQGDNLEAVRLYPTTEFQALAPEALGSVSRSSTTTRPPARSGQLSRAPSKRGRLSIPAKRCFYSAAPARWISRESARAVRPRDARFWRPIRRPATFSGARVIFKGSPPKPTQSSA